MLLTLFFSLRHALLRGFEIPILVLFLSSLEGETNDLFFSRCKSRLILVCKKEDADKLDPPDVHCDFAHQVPIFGKILITFVSLDWLLRFLIWLMAVVYFDLFSNFFVLFSVIFHLKTIKNICRFKSR